jgi:GT2 family glycosyltransferase
MDNKFPQVAIIIASFQGEKVIANCLSSLFASDCPDFEVIFVNNACQDKTREIVANQFPKVQIIDSKTNLGFAGGYNLGMQKAYQNTAEIIILINDDVFVEKHWLTAIIKGFQQDKQIGIIGSKLLYPDGKTIQHAGGIMYPNGRTWHRGNAEPDTGQWDKSDEPAYVTGASFAIRREVIERLGYLDEGYKPGYFEETDYCWRAKRLGYKVVYLPSSLAYHYESHSTVKYSSGFFEKYHRNRIRFVLKNFSLLRLYHALQEETKYRATVKGSIEYPEMIRAYKYNLIHLPDTLIIRWKTKRLDRKAKRNLE